MRIIGKVIAIVLLSLSITACKEEEVKEGLLKFPHSSSHDYEVDYEELYVELKSIGFTKVALEPLEDLITGWINQEYDVKEVSIDDKLDFDNEVLVDKDALITIYYHSFPIKDKASNKPSKNDKEDTEEKPDKKPSDEENDKDKLASNLEANFPVEMAKRSAVVAVTNYFATDVIASDGFTLDPTKFHSFSDQSGNLNDYFILIKNQGSWKAMSEDTWKVTNLELEHYAGLKLNVSFSITQKGEEYILTNPTGSMGSDMTFDEISNNPEVLTIPKKLVEKPREGDVQTYSSWVNQQYTSYDGSHKALKQLVKDSVYDSGSVENIKTEHISMIDESYLKQYNDMIISAGGSLTLELNDLFLIMDFETKDRNGNKVKLTAFGAVKYSNTQTFLLSIE